jgi:hypothetical protein
MCTVILKLLTWRRYFIITITLYNFSITLLGSGNLSFINHSLHTHKFRTQFGQINVKLDINIIQDKEQKS